jgi:hypothetical protein
MNFLVAGDDENIHEMLKAFIKKFQSGTGVPHSNTIRVYLKCRAPAPLWNIFSYPPPVSGEEIYSLDCQH